MGLSKVTQSCVDQYLDSILLQTIYTSAHQESLASMGLPAAQVEASLQVAPVDRRGSTGGLKEPPTPREGLKETGAVKARLRATQRKYLAAAHDQIWGMIDQFKV